MENNNLSHSDNLPNKGKEEKTIYIKGNESANLTICFCPCNCECHKKFSQENNYDSQKYINSPSNLKLNNLKKYTFSSQFLNRSKKEYSFDYNNKNIDINPRITKGSKDKKSNLFSGSDNNKTEEYADKESGFSSQGYGISNKENNERFDTKSNNSNNNDYEYILYRNDLTDFNQFINALHSMKNKEKKKNRCSSQKELISKYSYNNKIENNNKKNYQIEYSDKLKNLKNNMHNDYDNEKFYNNKKGKILSVNFMNNNKLFNNINNENKVSQNKKLKNNLSASNINTNKFLNYSRTEKNNLFDSTSSKYLNSTKLTSSNSLYNNQENNSNKHKLYNYKEDIIKRNNNNDYAYNFYYSQREKKEENNNNNPDPLGHIVNNFVSMLKYKNYNSSMPNIGLYNKNQCSHNDDIIKRKKNLNNKGIIKENPKFTYQYQYISKDLSCAGNRIKKIEIYKKNILGKKEVEGKKEEYKKKYGTNCFSHLYNENKKCDNNTNNSFYYYGIYNNNKLYKCNKYNEVKIQKKIKNIYKENDYKTNSYKQDKNNNNLNLKNNRYYYDYSSYNIKEFSNKNLNKEKNNKINKSNTSKKLPKKKGNKFKIETFNIFIQDKENEIKKKDKMDFKMNKAEQMKKNEYNYNSPSKKNKKIEIQSISKLTYYPVPLYGKTENNFSKQKSGQKEKILSQSAIIKDKKEYQRIETVPEKVRKLISKKALMNIKDHNLSSKLNLDTNLTLSEECVKNCEDLKRNIPLNPKSIFTVYNNNSKPIILAFDIGNKAFSFQDFYDFGNFEENYKLSLNKGNLFITIDTNLYIVTGKQHDMLYMFDSIKKTMNKLCNLENNHSNGSLLYLENSIICLSGDYNKKVEIYSINKNEWKNLPDMLIERSNSATSIINHNENKYIFNLFGYNSPAKIYLNTIEYLVINKNDVGWKYLRYNNPNGISLNICKIFCFSNDNKIIIFGGNNEKGNKHNDRYIQINLGKDFEKDINIKYGDKKIENIDINKKYYFGKGHKRYLDKDTNEVFYEIFDDEYNCHLFNEKNMSYNLFNFQS